MGDGPWTSDSFCVVVVWNVDMILGWCGLAILRSISDVRCPLFLIVFDLKLTSKYTIPTDTIRV